MLEDNYAYVMVSGKHAVVVDPSEAGPVRDLLVARDLELTDILITHYDYDHIGGVETLRRTTGCRVHGPSSSPFALDEVVLPGTAIKLRKVRVDVIDTPGHASPHVAYLFSAAGWLFSGDCLFGGGCGRVSGGAYATMFQSLQRLADLPGEIHVYCGHEYTLSNLAFAAVVEPDNTSIPDRVNRVKERIAGGHPIPPSTMAEERLTNPFLRTGSKTLRAQLGLSGAGDLEVFTELRRRKDRFRG